MGPLQLEPSSWEVRKPSLLEATQSSIICIMFKFVAISCFVTLALGAPNADPQLLVDGIGAVTLPAAAHPSPNCRIEYDEIETQKCTPRTNRVCDTKELKREGVKYKQVCKDVVSKHCGGPPAVAAPAAAHLLFKREADAQLLHPYAGGAAVLPAAAVAAAHPVPASATVTTIKHECHEVTSKHCVDTPEKVVGTVPVERCHLEQVVDCEPVFQRVPKTVCEPVETKVVTHGLFHHL